MATTTGIANDLFIICCNNDSVATSTTRGYPPMSRVLAAIAILSLGLVSSPVWAEGAIAQGRDGRVGISYNFRHRGEAEERALEECGGYCRVIARFENTCASIATGRGGGFGWARRERLHWADEAALENCRAEGNRSCAIQVHGCDDR